MKRHLSTAKTALGAVVALLTATALTECVDNTYDLDNISKEVSVGGDEIILPLGKINEKSLKELLGDDIEGFDFDSRYDAYTVNYTGSESFVVDGIKIDPLTDLSPDIDPVSFSIPSMPQTFELSDLTEEFSIEYPEMGSQPVTAPIEAAVDIDTDIPAISGNIPALGMQKLSFSGKTAFEMSIEVAPQIANIGNLYFGDGASDYGSPVEMTLSFNGAKSINGGGYMDMQVRFPEYCTLTDNSGRKTGNVFEVKHQYVPEGTEYVSFRFYLTSADLSSKPATDGVINISEDIEYGFTYDFEAVSGFYNPTFKPAIKLYSQPAYSDMEVVTNRFTVDNGSHSSEVSYTFNGIPEGVADIHSIAFTNAPVTLSLKGLEWLGNDALTAKIRLPKCFTFDPHSKLDANTNTLTATLAELQNGITLNINKMDCSGSEASVGSGQLTIRSTIEVSLGEVPAGLKLHLSEIKPQTYPVTVCAVIDASTMEVDLDNTKVSLREHNFDFNFGANNTPTITKTISLPKEIAAIEHLSVQNIDGKDVKTDISVSLPEGQTFPVEKVLLDFTINLRQKIHPTEGQKNIETAANGDHIFHVERLEWHPNTQRTLNIASILIDRIENLPEITDNGNGHEMYINEAFSVTGGVTVPSDSGIDLSKGKLQLDMDISVEDIFVKEFVGKVDYTISESEQTEIDLSALSDFGLTINNAALSPIFDIYLDNSDLDIPFNVDIDIMPSNAEGDIIEQNRIKVEGVHIDGGRRNHIVISTEERRSEYEDAETTFVAADISRLLSGEIPSNLLLAINVSSDTESMHTIDLTQSEFTIVCDYSVDIPLEFGRALDITYSNTITDLADAFSSVADTGVKVKHIAIVIDFDTSIPLDMILSAELLDADGNRTATNINMGDNCIVRGHNGQNGGKTTRSTVVLGLDAGEDGDLSALKDVDALRFSLNLRNSGLTGGKLQPDQVISGRAKLQVNGGITVDLDEL